MGDRKAENEHRTGSEEECQNGYYLSSRSEQEETERRNEEGEGAICDDTQRVRFFRKPIVVECRATDSERGPVVRRKSTLHKGLLIVILVLLSAGQGDQVAADDNAWASLGPEGGNISALAVAPQSPDTLYAGTDAGSVFKSTDSGASWHAVNIVVRKSILPQAIVELRSIGGSGVIVTPVKYIFEEEPEEFTQLLAALNMPGKGVGHVENL